jgi:signal transduction histidine kinase
MDGRISRKCSDRTGVTRARLRYSFRVPTAAPPNFPPKSASYRSPTGGLLLGLIITLAVVLAYASYITVQLSGLRRLQSDMVDRNRKDSLQLLRIHNDLNSVALAMRDMLDTAEPYPLTAWSAQFERLHDDLDAGLKLEETLAGANRTPEQHLYLDQSLSQFWDAVNRMFALASAGKDIEAREQIRLTLQARQQALSTAVSRLLVENNEGEEQATARITRIYDSVQRQLYIFLAATLIAIALTSLYLIRSNRQIFARLAELSEQRSELAQKLISAQESTLRHISRELHDEFGQVLTAIGAMLGRAGNQAPPGSPLRNDIQEVREIAQSTLNNIRSLSQALHPVLLEEAGLESTLDWYIPTVERQSGIHLHYEKSGRSFSVDTSAGVHIYRILQEALNNVTRHAYVSEAWIRLKFLPRALQLDVEDHGKGFAAASTGSNGTIPRGLGLVAMRERAELVGGTLDIARPPEGGTLVRLKIPQENLQPHAV